MVRDKYLRSYSGFETQREAEHYLEQEETLFKQSQKDWKDWQLTSTVLRQNGMITAEFTAVYEPQQ